MKWVLILLIGLGFGNQVSLSWHRTGNTVVVEYDSNDAITGFQFQPTVPVRYARSRLSYGGPGLVVVFAGGSLPAGHGVLCILKVASGELCMNNLIVVGSDLQEFDMVGDPGCLSIE